MSILILDRLAEYISADKKERRLYNIAALLAVFIILMAFFVGWLLRRF